MRQVKRHEGQGDVAENVVYCAQSRRILTGKQNFVCRSTGGYRVNGNSRNPLNSHRNQVVWLVSVG